MYHYSHSPTFHGLQSSPPSFITKVAFFKARKLSGICDSADPTAILGCVEQTYQLKENPCKPARFLGATIKDFYFQGNAKPRWAMSSNEYIKNAIKTVEIELAKYAKKASKIVCSVIIQIMRHIEFRPIATCQWRDCFGRQSLVPLSWAVEL